MADNEDDYNRRMFGTIYPDKERMEAAREKALEKAHEIRQFEIRLYWQRSLFFWGFDVAFFVAYIAILSSANAQDLTLLSAVIVFMGICTTIMWFFVAKGSKAWQENWEHHIDILEDGITGNLYKTMLGKTNGFYSVSKIQNDFIILVGVLWVGLFVGFIYPALGKDLQSFLSSFDENEALCIALISLIALIICFGLIVRFRWKTGKKTLGMSEPTEDEVAMHERGLPGLKSPPKPNC